MRIRRKVMPSVAATLLAIAAAHAVAQPGLASAVPEWQRRNPDALGGGWAELLAAPEWYKDQLVQSLNPTSKALDYLREAGFDDAVGAARSVFADMLHQRPIADPRLQQYARLVALGAFKNK
jgi:hypothetical protein